LAVPFVLRCNLRQQQPAMETLLDDQSVAADLDRVEIHNLFFRREHRDIEGDICELVRQDGRKPGIGISDDFGEVSDDLSKRPIGVDTSKASTELAVMKDGDERSA